MAKISHWTFTRRDGLLSWSCCCLGEKPQSIPVEGLGVDNARNPKTPDAPALHLFQDRPRRNVWFYYNTDHEAQVAASIVRELVENRATSYTPD